MVFDSPLNWFRPSQAPQCRVALSSRPSLDEAVRDVVSQLGRRGDAQLALVFASTGFASDLQRLMPMLRSQLRADHWIGCAGGGVIGTNADGQASELEQCPGLSVTLLTLPGASIAATGLSTESLPDLDGDARDWQSWVGIDAANSRSQIVLIDPTSSQINDLISGLDYAYPQAAKLGGIAAPHNAPHGSLFLNDRVVTGAVIASIGSDWCLEPAVAQGCRPIGPVFAIEQVQRNVLLELSHGDTKASPVACLQKFSPTSTNQIENWCVTLCFWDREKQSGPGLFAGRGQLACLSGPQFDRRGPQQRAVAVAERVRAGQNVQFHLREAEASRQDALDQLKRVLNAPAAPVCFGLLMACMGRGSGLFGTPDGDISLARSVMPELPVAGAFCNGEIGPVAGSTHLHGYAAAWGLLRHSPLKTTDALGN